MMNKLAAVVCVAAFSVGAVFAEDVKIESPSGRIKMSVSVPENGKLTYDVSVRDKAVFSKSPLGINLGRSVCGDKVKFVREERKFEDSTYPTRGVHALAHNHYNEVDIYMHDAGADTDFTLEVRVFDDAVAFRYLLPKPKTEYNIGGEASAWRFAVRCHLWAAVGNDKYEANIRPYRLLSLPRENIYMPLTAILPNNLGYACLTEANLIGYPGSCLTRGADRMSIKPAPCGRMKTDKAVVTPWRVAILAKDLTALVNTDAIKNLCPPPSKELANADWIKPGRFVWSWWSSDLVPPAKQKEYADMAKELGFEYNIITWHWDKWKNPWETVADIVSYSEKRGVRVWIWEHSNKLRTPEVRKKYFAKAAKAGVAGLKIDFMPPESAETVQLYDDILKLAAEYKLMINFHGACKPTGRARTWPQEVSREGIRGLEMRMKGRFSTDSQHDAVLPFTRFVIGAGDFTPTAFNPDLLDGYSWPHELAQAIVFTSPIVNYAEKPELLLANPAVDIIKTIPTVWDETIVLKGSSIGKRQVAAFARRTGDTWFIGILNCGWSGRFNIDLSFLPEGSYKMEIFEDDHNKPAAYKRSEKVVTNKDSKMTSMRAKGGFVARLTPVK
jgi:alpha-glucosidase